MTTIHKLTLKSIAEIEQKIAELQELIDAKPITRMCEIQQEFSVLLKDNLTIEQRLSKEFGERLNYLNDENEKAKSLANKQQNIISMIDEASSLRIELEDLKRELFYIEQKK